MQEHPAASFILQWWETSIFIVRYCKTGQLVSVWALVGRSVKPNNQFVGDKWASSAALAIGRFTRALLLHTLEPPSQRGVPRSNYLPITAEYLVRISRRTSKSITMWFRDQSFGLQNYKSHLKPRGHALSRVRDFMGVSETCWVRNILNSNHCAQ